MATGNMATVDKGKLNAWIARRKAENHTGYADAPTPFVVTPDEAWQVVLQGNDEMETDWMNRPGIRPGASHGRRTGLPGKRLHRQCTPVKP